MYENTIKKLESIHVWGIIDDYMIDNEDRILKMARDRMKRGESVHSGSRIGYYNAKWYRDFKEVMNPLAGGTVDLYLTGALQRAMEIREEARGIYLIHSTDKKYFDLASKYGADEFGITEAQEKQIKEGAIKEVINQIYKAYE